MTEWNLVDVEEIAHFEGVLEYTDTASKIANRRERSSRVDVILYDMSDNRETNRGYFHEDIFEGLAILFLELIETIEKNFNLKQRNIVSLLIILI